MTLGIIGELSAKSTGEDNGLEKIKFLTKRNGVVLNIPPEKDKPLTRSGG